MLSFPNPPLLCLSVLLLLLHRSSVLSHETWTSSQCHDAPFVPGHDLAGCGYDLVSMKRKAHVIDVTSYLTSSGTCNLYRNPLLGDQLQKVPLCAGEWRPLGECKVQRDHTEHNHVSSLIHTYSKPYSKGWQADLSPFSEDSDYVGTRSDVYNYANTIAKDDRYSYSNYEVNCSHYSYHLLNNPPINKEFHEDVQSLPSSYGSATKINYRQLIDKYGTHYTSEVELGGRLNRVTAARICLSSLNGLSSHQVHECLQLGLSVGLGYSTSPRSKSCDNVLHNQDVSTAYKYGLHSHHTYVVGGGGWGGECSHLREDSLGYRHWLETLRTHPGIITQSLSPLHTLVTDWNRKIGLKAAIEHYLKENAIRPSIQPAHCLGGPHLNHNCCPQQAWWGQLTVISIRGWKLKGDKRGKSEAYAIVKHKHAAHKTPVIRSNNPTWKAQIDLGMVDTRESLTVEVWDKDKGRDDLLVSCVFNVQRGKNKHKCRDKKGKVLVKYTLTCDRHLAGDKCNLYKPTSY